MSWIAGIDYSTHAVDVVLIDEDGELEPAIHRVPLYGNDALDRTRAVYLWNITWDDVLAVGIEEPAGRNPGRLFRVQGAILKCIPREKLVTTWMPSQWRKAVGLPGNCGKDMVAFFAVNDGRPDEFRDWAQDTCDAYCIALATRQAITREQAA